MKSLPFEQLSRRERQIMHLLLEVDQKKGQKMFSCLMLNHSVGLYKSVQKNYPIHEEDFFHQNFAFYFTVQQ